MAGLLKGSSGPVKKSDSEDPLEKQVVLDVCCKLEHLLGWWGMGSCGNPTHWGGHRFWDRP